MLSVAALWRRGQPGHISCPDLAQDLLEGRSGPVVAFVHDHMTVPGHQICDRAPTHETLERGDIDDPSRAAFAVTDSADGPRVDVEEHRKLRDPLFEEWSQVHQHERVPGPFGNHANAGHRLAHARRRDEHSDVMGLERAHCVLLKLRRRAAEAVLDGVSILSLVINLQRCAQGLEQRGGVVDAPARQRDMPGEVLRTADDARDARGGEPQPLLLIEVGVLEGGNAPQRG